MKKNIVLLFLTVVCVLFGHINAVSAQECLKNFYGYEVKNVNIREFGVMAREAITSYDGPDRGIPLTDVKNAYIYVVANEKYDVNNNDITNFLKQAGYKYGKLEDKAAMKEYQFDFYALARKKQLGNFTISPDLVKPLKTGMSKLNNKLAKNNKKTSVIPYSIDSAPINLTCVDTTGYFDEESQIAIVQNEYRLKEKENKYVHAHEYILTNKNNSTAYVTVTSERLAGLKDVATESFVDLDRLDLLDTVASFPPVLICTAGTSILCSVPNWLRLARITKESTRYAHALPDNYKLRSQGRMRILVLKYKDNPKPLNFAIKFDNQTYNLSF